MENWLPSQSPARLSNCPSIFLVCCLLAVGALMRVVFVAGTACLESFLELLLGRELASTACCGDVGGGFGFGAVLGSDFCVHAQCGFAEVVVLLGGGVGGERG